MFLNEPVKPLHHAFGHFVGGLLECLLNEQPWPCSWVLDRLSADDFTATRDGEFVVSSRFPHATFGSQVDQMRVECTHPTPAWANNKTGAIVAVFLCPPDAEW